MYYEYLLDLNAYYYLNFREINSCGETVTIWGEDECDALVSRIEKNMNRKNKDPRDDEVKVYYKLSRLRPTGRSLKYKPRHGVKFFNTDARSYIRGLITRFMVRFLVSDTIEEIDNYKKEYDDYLERYQHEFEDEVLEGILDQYKNQRNKILSGEVKPLSPSYDLTYFNVDKSAVIKYHAEHTSKLMKMFGYRVNWRNNYYEVLKPIYYDDNYDKITRNYYMTFSPLDLIIYWSEEFRNCAYPYGDIYSLEDNPEELLKYVVSAYDKNTLAKIEESLKKFDINCFYQESYDNDYPIWVYYTHYNLANEIINSIEDSLTDSGYDQEYCICLDYEDDEIFGSCVFCGSNTYGDILCPDCANNVD